MRALNSQRQQATTLCTLVSILIVFILDIHGTHSRSVVPDDQVIDKSLQADGKLDTALKIVEGNQGIVQEQAEKNDAGKLTIDSGESVKVVGAIKDEGIRRFDSNVEVEVEESNKAITPEVIAAKPTKDDIITKVIIVNDQQDDIDESNQQKRSVQSSHEPINDDNAKINAEIIDEGAKGLKSVENVHVEQIPELIPVAVDHVDIYQNISPEVGNARKSLINVDDDENEGKNRDEVRNERSHVAKEEKKLENTNQQSKVQQWKEQALLLQGQLKNNSFIQRLKEQAIEVLPDIPKFNENQLLQLLKTISSKKYSGSTESYIESMDTTILNESELEIFKCAEGLVAQKQRQTFSENIFECFRGLSILNCMRIFIWPIIVDNVPESISQNFPSLPIEVSISDLIPGNRDKPKTVRATTAVPQQRLITPELVVANILKDALESNIHDDKLPTYFNSENETLVKLLTPGQIEILKTAEKFLPESAREEYSNSMYSCVRRFEYFSCIKYFAWPMIKQHFPALPEFPDYQSWYPSTISVYPDYPILPFTHYQEENGELPEVVEADEIRNRSPRPETLIVNILKNTLDQQSRQPLSSSITSLNEDAKYMTAEQLKSIQMAEQLIPDSHRADFVAKTMECIKQYGYLTCTKHLTWPTIREHQPRFPNFPDLSSWFGTYTNPQFSDLISLIPQPPSLSGLIPSISVGGSTQTGLGSISGSISTGGGGGGGGGGQGGSQSGGQIGGGGQGGSGGQTGGGGQGGGSGQIGGGGQGGGGGQIGGGGQGGGGGQIGSGSQGGGSNQGGGGGQIGGGAIIGGGSQGGSGGSGGQIGGQGGNNGQIGGGSTGGSGSTGGQSGNPGGIIIIIPGNGQGGGSGSSGTGQINTGGNTGGGQIGGGSGGGGNGGQTGSGGISWGGQGSQGGNTGGGGGSQGSNNGGGISAGGGGGIAWGGQGNQGGNTGSSQPGNGGISWGGQGSQGGNTGSNQPGNGGITWGGQGNQGGNTGNSQPGNGGVTWGGQGSQGGNTGNSQPGNGGVTWGGQGNQGGNTGGGQNGNGGSSITIIIPGNSQISNGGNSDPGNQWGNSGSGQINTGGRPTGSGSGTVSVPIGSPGPQAPNNQWGGNPGSSPTGSGLSGNAPSTGGIPSGSPGGQVPGNQWGGSPSGGQISGGSPGTQVPSNQWGGSPSSGQIPTGSIGGQAPTNQWGGSPGSGQVGGGLSGNAPSPGGIPSGSPAGQAPGNQWGGSPSGGQIPTGSLGGQAPTNQWGGSPGSGQVGGGMSGNAPSPGGIPSGAPVGQAPGNQWGGSPSGSQIPTGSAGGQAPTNQWGGSPGSGQVGGGLSGNAPSPGGIPSGAPVGQAPGNQWGGSPSGSQIPTGSIGGQAPTNQWGGSPSSGQVGGGLSGNAPSPGGIPSGAPVGQAPGNQWGGSPSGGQISPASPGSQAPSNQWGGSPTSGQISGGPSTGGIPTGSPTGQAPNNQWGGSPGSGQISGGPSGNVPTTGGIPTSPSGQGNAGGTIGYPGNSGGNTPSLPSNNPIPSGGSSPSGNGDVSVGTPGIGQSGTPGTPSGSGTVGPSNTDPTNIQPGSGIIPGSDSVQGGTPTGLPDGQGTIDGTPMGGTDNSPSPGGNVGGDSGINAGYPGNMPGSDIGSVPLCPCVPPSNSNSQNLKTLEPQVLSLLSNLRYSSYHSPLRMPYAHDKNSLLWSRLSKEQLAIMGLATNLIPHTGRRDLLSRSLGCLQGGAEFMICAREVIWPYLGLYLSNIPEFPNEQSKLYATPKGYTAPRFDQLDSQGQSPHSRLSNQPSLSHPFELNQANLLSLFGQPNIQIAARSPLQSGISAKANDDPIISVTGNRFVPIFSDQPEAVILNILNTISKSTPQVDEGKFTTRIPEFVTLLNSSLSEQQENIMKFVEKLLPETSRGNMFEEMIGCIRSNNDFVSCTRDTIWPKLSEYFPRIPNFPVFQQLRNTESNPENLQPLSEDTAAISETNVKTGHHGDAMVTITDTRFVPIYNDHPEEVILRLLTTLQSSNKQNEPMSFIVKSQPFATAFTEQQSKILSVAENLIPGSFRLAFIAQMNDCVRINNFLDCTRDIVWPVMGQFYPRLSTYPNFDSLPTISEGVPQHPTLLPPHHETNDYSRVIAPTENQIHQIPQVPNFAGHFSIVSDFSPLEQLQLAQHSVPLRTVQSSSVHPHISIHPGITSSVGTATAVPGFPGQPTEILLDISQERVPETHFSHNVRKRRSAEDLIVNDTQSRNKENTEHLSNQMKGPISISNLTESDVIELLNKITKTRFGSEIENDDPFFLESLNSSVIQSLTLDQIAILKMVEKLGIQNARGVVSQVLQCITGLSFIRCIGIFILPLITGALPTLNLPFGRSKYSTKVEEIFNAESIDAVEKQLLDQKKTVENILVDWYKHLTEEKYTTNYGSVRIEGHGNGEIGVKFMGLRNAKGVKIKDTKNLPSILTIISDIMEDVLDSKPNNNKPKKDKKAKSIEFKSDEILEQSEEFQQRSNDEKIIKMFIEKLKPNNTAVNGEDENRYLTVDDAYRAFEVLFGTKMRARFINKLESIYQTNDEREVNEPDEKVKVTLLDSNENKLNRIDQKEEKQWHHHNQHHNRIENVDSEKSDAALVFQFPRIHENVELAEKVTSSIASLSRRMKNNMVQMMPGLGFVVTFFLQVALAHARAAASVASLISNMALGSAVMTLMQQTLLSSRIEPKIKHLYVNAPETDTPIAWSP